MPESFLVKKNNNRVVSHFFHFFFVFLVFFLFFSCFPECVAKGSRMEVDTLFTFSFCHVAVVPAVGKCVSGWL